MTMLPDHATLIASPDVWMESAAVEQLGRVAALPGCLRAVGMPDLHPGRGVPIGAAFLFEGRVLPELVGGDAGCGVLMIAGRKDGPRGDALERRVLAALEEPLLPGVDPQALLYAAWHKGPRGVARVAGVPESIAELCASLPEDRDDPSGRAPEQAWLGAQLGTIGGGNHFAEIARVAEIADREQAAALGLARDAQAVLVHSGSRALGAALSERYAGRTLEGEAIEGYLADLRGAVRFARANRLLIAHRLLRAAGLASPGRIASVLDIVHNTAERRGAAFLHRKGAAPAEQGQATVVLGSRGAPSWLMQGLGRERCLACVAHGAGRRMGRSEAHAKLRHKHKRASLSRSALGTRVICDDVTLMYEEHPDAYKAIEPVVESLEHAEAARRVAALVPLITVKK